MSSSIMSGLPFEFMQPWFLLLAIVVIPLIWFRRKRQPAIGHTGAYIHNNMRRTPIIGWLPSLFYVLALLALVAALAKPAIPEAKEVRSMFTRDIFICVDISGSMSSAIPGGRPDRYVKLAEEAKKANPTVFKAQEQKAGPQQNPAQIQYRCLDAAQDAAYEFVLQRKGDRLGLAIFDDNVYYHWPLTDDLKVILRKCLLINRGTGGGTNFDGPSESAQGRGPIQAAIDHFEEYGKSQTKVLIMVSDGESTISPKRMKELTEQMKALNARAYLLGIGGSWVNSNNSPNTGSTKDLRNFIQSLGGKVFAVADVDQMQSSFEAINQLEKSQIFVETTVEYRPIYYIFVGVSLLFVTLFLVTSSLTRQVT
jgi:Ca-activated chloride channel family protein